MSTPTPVGEPTGECSITCSCPVCGVLTLRASAFTLVKCEWDPDRSFYSFTCPRCQEHILKQASARVVVGLTTRGVRVLIFPAEAGEITDMAGPPIGYDDLLDFLLALGDDATVAIALATLDAR